MSDLMTHFYNVTDIRKEKGKRHALIDIIVIAIVGVICGADDWVMIEQAGKTKEEWLRTFLELSQSMEKPCVDPTIRQMGRNPSIWSTPGQAKMSW